MLILTRCIGEKLRIGDSVTIVVLGAHGAQVRVGVDAPQEVSVHREEVYRRIQMDAARRRRETGDLPDR